MLKAIAVKEQGKAIQYPEGTQHYKDLHWQAYIDRAGVYCLQVWEGRSVKAGLYHNKTEDTRSRCLQWLMDRADNRETNRAERAKNKAENLAKIEAVIQPGCLLHYSWGYDQTQCEFFIVTRRTKSTVWIQKIGRIKTRDTGWASANYKADPAVKKLTEIQVIKQNICN